VSTFDLEINLIRKALKREAPTLSVRRARGTAYGWIDIGGSGELGEFTEREKRALEKFGLAYGANYANISPDARRYWVERIAEIAGLELPEELKREYAERDAERREMEREHEERRRIQESCQHDWELMPWLVFPNPERYAVIRCPKCKKTMHVEKEKLGEYLRDQEPPRRDDEKEDLDGIQPIAKTFNLSEDEAAKVLAALSSAIRNTENPAQAIERFTSLAPRELRKAFMFGFLLGATADTNAAEKDKPDYIG